MKKHATMNIQSSQNPYYNRYQMFDDATGKACTPWREVHKQEDPTAVNNALLNIAEERGYIAHHAPGTRGE